MTTLKSLLDVQIATKCQMEEIQSNDDLLEMCLSVITINAAQLISKLTYSKLKERKVNKDLLIKHCAAIIEHAMLFSNVANHDIDDEDLIEFEKEETTLEMKVDSILCAYTILGASSNISMALNIDLIKPLWDYDIIPEEIEYDLCSIIVSVKLIADKQGFTMDDVLAAIS